MNLGDHLLPHRRQYLSLSDNRRIEVINKDKIFINYAIADKIIGMTNNMLNVLGAVQAPCMLIKGEGGTGKTSIINQIRKCPKIGKKLAFMSMSVNPYDLKFGELLSESLGVPICSPVYTRARRDLLPAELCKVIKLRNIKGIIIDELHDAMLVARPEQLKNLSIIKGLTNEPYCLTIIGFGTAAAKSALTFDSQLSRRFHIVELEDWCETEEFRSFLAGVEQNLPLKYQSNLYGPEITTFLLQFTGGRMDEVVKIIKSAACYAIRLKEEKISLNNLKMALAEPWSY